ncbi:excalibur calcium-binding domain-containing protein [Colwellia sp. BRX10-3]|uniref:excalibur calcium-binding domain-containing protein n=1 Tax=Colwellia sp. BRX10-3 TaxID=2759844 RepID=UPI0015F74171|nr:excalibur calcium-binding domain-containing protein [Colwellia sp. BRX10-3]MBA6390618.1 excalibur calcium-binding domain-containing protein [Colwellia sp. BRX10-3]
MHKGQLKSWFDNKGFGFIESPELKQDTFIHISALKEMSRKPKIGDFIYFEVEQQSNGKTSAINCRIEGVAAKALKQQKHRVYKNSFSPKSKTVLLFAIIVVCAFAYQRLNVKTPHIPAEQFTAPKVNSFPPQPVINTQSQFSCDGRQHCSEMSSYEEAKYFLQNCPNTKMDGDGDGIPCERQFNTF